ncbi:hypothetical protein [Streptomyces niveus]|uniref:hypothetical protein n=1 Tax=Streptomyces niveus TaxID=193462 RepID=UPI0036D2B48C
MITDNGRNYRLLSCALRNTGSGWALINDSGHRPSGVTAVTMHPDHLEITHSVGALRVSSLQVSVDETFAGQGLRVGASVGLALSRIYLYTGCPCDGPAAPVDPVTIVASSGNLWVTGLLEVP